MWGGGFVLGQAVYLVDEDCSLLPKTESRMTIGENLGLSCQVALWTARIWWVIALLFFGNLCGWYDLDWLNAYPVDDGQQSLFWTEWAHELNTLGT